MKKIVNIIRWIGVALFGIMAIFALSQKGFLGAFLFLLGGFLITPLNAINKLRGKLKLKKTLSIIIAVILLFTGVLATPSSEVTSNPKSNTNVSNTNSNDTPLNKNTQTISKEEVTSKPKDISSKEETTSKNETSTSSTNNSSNSNNSHNTSCLHSNTTLKNASNSTCIKNGYSGDTYCNSCNKIIKNGSQIQAKGHDTEIRNQKSATTTSEGYTGDTYCKTCGVKVKNGEVIPKITDNTQQETNSKIVYITDTGEKYHSTQSCRYLKKSKNIYEITLDEAEEKNYGPCSGCH